MIRLTVPSHVLDSQPGDMLMFHSLLWHASFGGTWRRMFSIWYQAAGKTERERKVCQSMKDRADAIAESFA